MTRADKHLLHEVAGFRAGILDGRPSSGMCALVCMALQGYLSAVLERATEIVEGPVDVDGVGWCNHVWLVLADGRVLDPTLDQFNGVLGKEWPAVYLGAPIAEVHRPLEVPV